ncbi:hypothetical protein S40288_11712 [Stachybotrys chartarum IBT 40288]|nr:hypothetical protein S40288_11712 [Stachybotrys chartarum IBT 40288]
MVTFQPSLEGNPEAANRVFVTGSDSVNNDWNKCVDYDGTNFHHQTNGRDMRDTYDPCNYKDMENEYNRVEDEEADHIETGNEYDDTWNVDDWIDFKMGCESIDDQCVASTKQDQGQSEVNHSTVIVGNSPSLGVSDVAGKVANLEKLMSSQYDTMFSKLDKLQQVLMTMVPVGRVNNGTRRTSPKIRRKGHGSDGRITKRQKPRTARLDCIEENRRLRIREADMIGFLTGESGKNVGLVD